MGQSLNRSCWLSECDNPEMNREGGRVGGVLSWTVKEGEGQLGAQVTTFRVLRVWKPLGVGAGNPYVNGRRNGFGGFGWSE